MNRLTHEDLRNANLLFDRGWRYWNYEFYEDKLLLLTTTQDLDLIPDGTCLHDVITKNKNFYIKGISNLSKDSFMGLSIYGILINSSLPRKNSDTDESKMSDKMARVLQCINSLNY